MAAKVNDSLEVQTFGEDIVVPPKLHSIKGLPTEIIKDNVIKFQVVKDKSGLVNTYPFRIPPKKPKKLKPKALKQYLQVELDALDETWLVAHSAYEDKWEDTNVSQHELEGAWNFICRLEGQMDALYQLGRWFGIPGNELIEHMSNYASYDCDFGVDEAVANDEEEEEEDEYC